MRTADGYSKTVSAGNGMFTLLGFMGMYTVLAILFLFLVRREIEHGPEEGQAAERLPKGSLTRVELEPAALAGAPHRRGGRKREKCVCWFWRARWGGWWGR